MRPPGHTSSYAAFVSMFPHLIAGPIVRYADIETQLRRLEPRLTSGLAASGAWFFTCGLFKKLIIADTLEPYVSAQFAASGGVHFVHAWLAAVGYSLQLYFDFSGYSDMAVGLAYLLGFRFPQNFDSPFKAGTSRTSGGGGTCRSRSGCATTSSSRSGGRGTGG